MTQQEYQHYTQRPISQVRFDGTTSVREYIEAIAGSSYQSRELGRALYVFDRMLAEEKCTIFLALAGAMIPAGMRSMIVDLIENRLIDGIISTGANIIHDIVETIGQPHFRIDPTRVSDAKLGELRLNRIYDTVMPEDGFITAEHLLLDLFGECKQGHPYTTREFLHEIGGLLVERSLAKEPGMVTTMAREKLPFFCPALADSELGIDLLYGRWQRGQNVVIDTVADVGESAEVVWQTHLAGGQVAVITVGGGTPRNFIQQTAPALDCAGRPYPGHKYALGITTDVPFWGGMSGSTFEEAESWRKYNNPEHATVRADATIVLPMLYAAQKERIAAGFRRPTVPRFTFEGGGAVAVSFEKP
ncbi:MAG: deoxyhypusine synthase family protein [Dehalococcoidia bacterium]